MIVSLIGDFSLTEEHNVPHGSRTGYFPVAKMRKTCLILIALLILLLLVAIRKESDSSLRFMKKQNEISKPPTASTAH